MRRRAFVAACLALAAVFVGLGVWQVERRAWKLDLIAAVEARIHRAPKPFAPADPAYTRVRLAGRFAHDRATLVQAVTERGPGWWVMTPLATDAGTVLVNRGFVPDRRGAVGGPAGSVTVTGLVRESEPGGAFLRANDAAGGRWFSRDVAAIARARGLGTVAPVFVDADATPNPGGYPVGGLTIVSFRNTHLVYAVTWFGLAALVLLGAGLLLREGRR